MPRKKILVANWKTYIQKLSIVKDKIKNINDLFNQASGVIICPPAIYLKELANGIKNPNINIGSQNISIYESSANTGEILASMQKDIGCSYSIIGHSEVRNHYKESNDLFANKIKIAIKYDITPIICIGESIEVRNNADYVKFLINQLTESLSQIELDIFSHRIIVAYEPIWSIGTGVIPTTKQIEEVINTLRLISNLKECKFLYGGSVNEDNIKEIAMINSLDGVLVGGVSVDIDKLFKIYQILNYSG